MAEYKGDRKVFCVGPSDIPSDYSREEQEYGPPLWMCECFYFNRQAYKICDRCGEPRITEMVKDESAQEGQP